MAENGLNVTCDWLAPQITSVTAWSKFQVPSPSPKSKNQIKSGKVKI